MRNKDKALYKKLDKQLSNFSKNKYKLIGINSTSAKDVLIKQFIDSMRRVEYVYTICKRDISSKRADPSSDYFNPVMAAVFFLKKGNIDEAFWLAFLSINYGKNLRSGWNMTRDIYGRLGHKDIWTWKRTSSNPSAFKKWISSNHHLIQGSFGNHRKYTSLRPNVAQNPGAVIESYINWVGSKKDHKLLIQRSIDEVGSNPRDMFHYLYSSMSEVVSFGRTSKFDYLTMIAKLGLAPIEPGLTYMSGATGPAQGARLLFGGNSKAIIKCKDLESNLCELESKLSLGNLGMQVLEDTLCNWQKSPKRYIHFSG